MRKSQPCKNLGKELPGSMSNNCKGFIVGLNLKCSWKQKVNVVECREKRRRERERDDGEMRDGRARIKLYEGI